MSEIFEIGDRVKIINIGGIYSTYQYMAEKFGINDWVYGRYPETPNLFTIKGISTYKKSNDIIAYIENDYGEGFLFSIKSLRVEEILFELGEELFLV